MKDKEKRAAVLAVHKRKDAGPSGPRENKQEERESRKFQESLGLSIIGQL